MHLLNFKCIIDNYEGKNKGEGDIEHLSLIVRQTRKDSESRERKNNILTEFLAEEDSGFFD